jgi:myo-inositol 2-dehydrogenase / D-chiro-inositol 1-dehydrogenase
VSIRIGLIGCGVMGLDHARLLMSAIGGAELAGVYDADPARVKSLAALSPAIRIFPAPEALIADAAIDAVIVAAPDATHASLTLTAISARKPVLCEKPLAATLDQCREIIAAEMATGRRLVQVGFMRRFDPGYRAMKAQLDSGTLGQPLFLHCIHRNKVAPDYVTSDLVIANSMVHEMDIARFLLGEEFATVTVTSARRSRFSSARQPQFAVLETAAGVVVSIEMTPDSQYGYEVQGELVCEEGTVSLAPAPPFALRLAGQSGYPVEEDWRPRFADAYRIQLQEWVAAITSDKPSPGSSAWDGYAASLIAAAALTSLASGRREALEMPARPAFYDS